MDPRRLLLPLLVLALSCVAVTSAVLVLRPAQEQARAQAGVRPSAATQAREVLASWDRERSEAWERGRVGALKNLYTPGSRAGRADVASLRRWRARGFTVHGLQTQVLALEVESHSPSRLILVVTDRVVGGEAVGAEASVVLPADRASTRRVVLRRLSGRWVVDGVRDHPG